MAISPLRWTGRSLALLDQLALPAVERWIDCPSAAAVGRSITAMHVRGAPAIGVAAAYGMALAANASRARTGRALLRDLKRDGAALVRARPTAVNLAWAVRRIERVAADVADRPPAKVRERVLAEARAIEAEDLTGNRAMGRFGAALFPRRRSTILTHCNTGALATAGYGTALGVIRAAHAAGKVREVLVDETRPYLQGARLTAWELQRDRIPFTLITDNMAAHFMSRGRVHAVIVGADRITARGDTANKIGTYGLAVLAHFHRIPFYVAAPLSTVDLAMTKGSEIPIEERSAGEVVNVLGRRIAPKGIRAAHPAFDVTPGPLVTAIVTELGVAKPPYESSLRALMRRRRALSSPRPGGVPTTWPL